MQSALEQREKELNDLQGRLRDVEVAEKRAERRAQFGPSKQREQLRERLQDWQGVLQRHPAQAQQIIKKLLTGPLRFTPKRDAAGVRYYEFEGECSDAKLMSDVFPSSVASPTGFDPILRHDYVLEIAAA